MIRFACVAFGVAVLAGCAASARHGGTPSPSPSPTPGSGPYTAEQLAELAGAMDRLGWLVGRWEGEGFVNAAAPGSTPLPIRSEWEVTRRYDGRFLQVSFTNTRESGQRNHWAGFFTFDVAADEYATVWVNPGNAQVFQERGSITPDGGTLTLVSTHEGPQGEVQEVRSVFTRIGPDAFRVVDTTTSPGAEPVVTFSFSLQRRVEGAPL